LSIGAFVTFATESTGFSKEFPGIIPKLCTLPAQFYTPFWREILLGLGLSDSNYKSCINGLQGPGSSIVLVIGGAQESLYSRPGTADLCLLKRKGFVKVALESGASLVPVFAFGETDLWDQYPNPEGSKVRKFQETMKNLFTFTLPLINGRGVFQYGYGLMPQRRPIHVVIGEPIHVKQMDKPTSESIEEYHAMYMEGLKKVYDTYKDQYSPKRISDISFKG